MPRNSAPLWISLALGLCQTAFGETPDCQQASAGVSAELRYVIDGDTLILSNNRHVRLIGIDAPELEHRGESAQIYGQEARAALAHLLPARRGRIQLLTDGEQTDRYGRLLAHAFLPDGTNVQAWLLRQGYTRRYRASSGTLFKDCYAAAEATAVKASRGLWALPQNQPIPTKQLPANTRGYRSVAGTIQRIAWTKASIWLDLSPDFALRIAREDWRRFPLDRLRAWQGQRITARGYIYAHDGQLRMRITEPSQLELAPPAPKPGPVVREPTSP